MSAIAICINPMSGRDVRRLAAKATNITPQAKRDMVARIAIGADAAGIENIFLSEEPFRIAQQALSLLKLSAQVHILKTPLRHTAQDTEAAVEKFLAAGVATFVTLGGDGTNRAIVRGLRAQGAKNANLVPLSAGTNNAFPALAEPTITGMVAGLAAQGRLDGFRRRCKVLHVALADGSTDVGLIDATVLAGDSTGNLLPFDTQKLSSILLTRSDPAVVGMAAIGGLLQVVSDDDDCALLVTIGAGGSTILAPVSPGLFEPVDISSATRIPLDQPVIFEAEAVLALDGDRDHRLHMGAPAQVTVKRDAPWVFDTNLAIRYAVNNGLLPEAFVRPYP